MLPGANHDLPTPTHTPPASWLSQGFHNVRVWKALPKQTCVAPTDRGQATPPPAGVNVRAMATGMGGNKTEASASLHS